MRLKKQNVFLYISCFLFFISFLFLVISRNINGFSTWYTLHIYPNITAVIGRIFNVFPFSAAEILLYLSVFYILFCFISSCVHICKKESNIQKIVRSFGRKLFTITSILLFMYTFACGINYYNLSFAKQCGLERSAYTKDELYEFCSFLVKELNEKNSLIMRNQDKIFQLSSPLDKESIIAMQSLGKRYKTLSGFYPRPKYLTVPAFLSIQQLSGIYCPFTIEANYNNAMTPYNLPFTACHELSHLKGFMREDESNFIAYLACRDSDNPDFQYSGSLLAFIYAGNELYNFDPIAYSSLRKSLANEILIDLDANSEFWDLYENPVAKLSNEVNDVYLKLNDQKEGVKTYDAMVNLMIADYFD